MNDMSLSSLYRRMTSRSATDIGAADSDAFAGSSARASLARMLRELQPESEALAAAVATRRHAAHPLRGRESRVAAGARRPQGRSQGLRWVGALAACFAFAFALNLRHGEAPPQHWDDVAAAASSAPLPDRIFTTRDRIFAASDDAPRGVGGELQADRLFQAHFAIGG